MTDLLTILQEQIDGYQKTCLIYAAAKSGLMDALITPKSVNALASELGLQRDPLDRSLRCLSDLKLVEATGGLYSLTESGTLLSSQHPNSQRYRTLAAGEQYLLPWSQLLYSLQTGKPSFEKVFGMTPWRLRQENSRASEVFDAYLENEATEHLDFILDKLDLSGADSVLDIGGGKGQLVSRISKRAASGQAIVFDQPHVIQGVTEVASISGDFFESIPEGFSVYLMKSVLHDWPDRECIAILRNCRQAMSSLSKLCIIERTTDTNVPDTHFVDVHMLVITGGRERSLDQYRSLLDEAGLEIDRVISTASPFSILMCHAQS